MNVERACPAMSADPQCSGDDRYVVQQLLDHVDAEVRAPEEPVDQMDGQPAGSASDVHQRTVLPKAIPGQQVSLHRADGGEVLRRVTSDRQLQSTCSVFLGREKPIDVGLVWVRPISWCSP
jgi:hypothetical protein